MHNNQFISCKDNPLPFLRGYYYKVTGITMVEYVGGETEGECDGLGTQ